MWGGLTLADRLAGAERKSVQLYLQRQQLEMQRQQVQAQILVCEQALLKSDGEIEALHEALKDPDVKA